MWFLPSCWCCIGSLVDWWMFSKRISGPFIWYFEAQKSTKVVRKTAGGLTPHSPSRIWCKLGWWGTTRECWRKIKCFAQIFFIVVPGGWLEQQRKKLKGLKIILTLKFFFLVTSAFCVLISERLSDKVNFTFWLLIHRKTDFSIFAFTFSS